MNRPYPAWDPALDDAFVCTGTRVVAPDVLTVLLAPPVPATIDFQAGQYVRIEFDVEGDPVQRCYTISSPPTRPERLAITVKRTQDGLLSPWLHGGGLRPGTVVRVGAPQGTFTLERHPAPAHLLLTAGTGITPALSMLRESYDLGTEHDLVLVHSQRRAGDVPYADELAWIVRDRPGVRMHVVARDVDVDVDVDVDGAVVGGRLNAALLARLVPDAATREVFVCGPDGYRDAARAAARALGVAAAHVHEESFTFAAARPGALPAPGAAQPGAGFRVEFRDHGVVVDCPADVTVLDAAAAAGLTLPSSCAQGLCGTCKSTLVSGEVNMTHAGGIRPREIAAGKILLCCSRPRTDLVVTG